MKKILISLVIVAVLVGVYIFSQKNTGQNDLNVNNKNVSDVPVSVDPSLPGTSSDGEGKDTTIEGTSDKTGETINL